MSYTDKRCMVCREWYEPMSGKQLVCPRCRQYYFLNGITGKARSFDEARRLYLEDMRRQHRRVSAWPAAKGCEGCHYWRSVTGGSVADCCHYYLDTHMRRPCPPGERCAVRIKKKKGEKDSENARIDNHGDDLGLY